MMPIDSIQAIKLVNVVTIKDKMVVMISLPLHLLLRLLQTVQKIINLSLCAFD